VAAAFGAAKPSTPAAGAGAAGNASQPAAAPGGAPAPTPAPAGAPAAPPPPPAGTAGTAATAATRLTRAQIGSIGEQQAANVLRSQGYTNLRSIQNASGHGIDIIAERNGQTYFFEVKASAGARVPGLSQAQQNIQSFVNRSLGRAAASNPMTPQWRGISAATRQDAANLLREIQAGNISIQGQVIEVTGVGTANMQVTARTW
jgi:Holliday junction resolvase-like predicted endonuclease